MTSLHNSAITKPKAAAIAVAMGLAVAGARWPARYRQPAGQSGRAWQCRTVAVQGASAAVTGFAA